MRKTEFKTGSSLKFRSDFSGPNFFGFEIKFAKKLSLY